MKIFVTKQIEEIEVEYFDGKAEDVLDKLKGKIITLKENVEWKNLVFKPYRSYDSASIELHGDRLETDKEFEDRMFAIKKSIKNDEKQKQKRKSLYNKLKREFEDE